MARRLRPAATHRHPTGIPFTPAARCPVVASRTRPSSTCAWKPAPCSRSPRHPVEATRRYRRWTAATIGAAGLTGVLARTGRTYWHSRRLRRTAVSGRLRGASVVIGVYWAPLYKEMKSALSSFANRAFGRARPAGRRGRADPLPGGSGRCLRPVRHVRRRGRPHPGVAGGGCRRMLDPLDRESEEFFDLLGQRPVLLQQVFAAGEAGPPPAAASDTASPDTAPSDRTGGGRGNAGASLDESS